MSEHHDSNEELKEDSPKVVSNHSKYQFKFNKNLVIVGLILLALPLTVGLVLVQQEIRGRAAGQTIAKVEVSPGAVNSMENGPSVGLSALAYDYSGNPIFSGVSYEWSMSSTNTVGTLTKTSGVVTEFKPLKYGCGQITVIARPSTNAFSGENKQISLVSKANAQSLGASKSVVVSVGSPNGMPNCGAPSVTSAPPSGNTKIQTSLKCSPSMSLNDYTSKQLVVSLVDANGRVLSSKNISWSREAGTSGYPLISPSNAVTNTGGEAVTNISLPQGFSGTGRNTIKSEFLGDSNYHPSTCYTTVSYSVSNITQGPSPIPAVKITNILPFQDAFVRSDRPTTNFGYGGRLRADDSPRIISYLKFDISPVIGKKIVSAKLRLRVSTDAGSGSSNTFNLRNVTLNSWNEGSVTYNNRPSLGTTVKSFAGKGDGATIDIDVKSLIGNTNRFSWAIATSGTNELILQSREAGTGKPQLIIEYQ